MTDLLCCKKCKETQWISVRPTGDLQHPAFSVVIKIGRYCEVRNLPLPFHSRANRQPQSPDA